MTITEIEDKIEKLTAQLHGDTRPTRGADGKPLDNDVLKERLAIKSERKELRKELAILTLEAEADVAPRDVAELESMIEARMLEVRTLKNELRALNRERDRAKVAERVAQMSEAEKAALRKLLAK